MKKVIFLFSGVLFLFIYACGYQAGIIQKADKSYFKFTGNRENVSVAIDELKPFVLESKEGNKMLYQTSPGKHSLKVYRNGELLIDRLLFLENQAATEVQIPLKEICLF